MITINELRKALNRIAPEESAESWDNCGFQINTGRENYSRILVCLEITKAVIEEAKEKKYEASYLSDYCGNHSGGYPGVCVLQA